MRLRTALALLTVAPLAVVSLAGCDVLWDNGPIVPPVTLSTSPAHRPAPEGLPWGCAGQSLPVPEGFNRETSLGGIDPSGHMLVGKVKSGDQTRLAIWSDGKLHAAFSMPGETVYLNDVTRAGVAVGMSLDGPAHNPRGTAWKYDGQLARLPGEDTLALAINEAGVIAGSAKDRPAIWRPGKSTPDFLPLPAGESYGWATGITEAGVVVGQIGDAPYNGGKPLGSLRAFAWYPDGSSRELVSPEPAASRVFMQSAAGDWAFGITEGNPVLWDLRTGAARPAAGMRGTNAKGWVLSGNLVWNVNGKRAVIPGDVDGKSSGQTASVLYVSDDGRTLAGVMGPTVAAIDGQLPVLWRCRSGPE